MSRNARPCVGRLASNLQRRVHGFALLNGVGLAKNRVGRVDIKEGFSIVEVSVEDAARAIRGLGGLTVRVNYFGAVATLERLRPLLLGSDAPRAVVVASEAVFHETDDAIVDACLAGDD